MCFIARGKYTHGDVEMRRLFFVLGPTKRCIFWRHTRSKLYIDVFNRLQLYPSRRAPHPGQEPVPSGAGDKDRCEEEALAHLIPAPL